MACYAYKGFIPVVHPSAFVHPQAAVTGNVVIGKDVYVGPGCALRGDWGGIVVEDGCNIQENCTVHMFPGVTVTLEKGAHVGHGAIIHGAHLGANCLIGMNAVVMDNASIGAGSVVGALTFVPAKTQVPDRVVFVGNPGKVVKEVSNDMLDWKTKGTALYQALPGELHETLEAVEPLTEVPANRPSQESLYQTWQDIKGQ